MKLTGKAKEDFEKWLISQNKNLEPNTPWAVLEVQGFNALKDNRKWGVYVDFFDSVGMILNIGPKWDFSGYLALIEMQGEKTTYANKVFEGFIPFKTISEARKAAVQRANEIYNQLPKER